MSDCEEWRGAINGEGYGVVTVAGALQIAHRVSYQLHNGDIPRGWMVDHICRNKKCINPDHLRLATNKQNQENREVAGNGRSGVRGVAWIEQIGKWRAQVRHNGKLMTFGSFDTIEEAAEVVATKRRELFTHNDSDRR